MLLKCNSFILFIILTFAKNASGNLCKIVSFDRHISNTPCIGPFSSEVFRQMDHCNSILSWAYCCIPGTIDEIMTRSQAAQCRVTPCLPVSFDNTCQSLPDRFINETKLLYRKTYQESCGGNQDSFNVGAISLCCPLDFPKTKRSFAKRHEFPHQALIKTEGLCGGTIYYRRFLVTAAHCVLKRGIVLPVSEIYVVLGTNMAGLRQPENIYEVKQVIPHPEYGELATCPDFRLINDIALVELNRDVEFGDTIKALEIVDNNFDPFRVNKTVQIIGWGRAEKFTYSDLLHKDATILRSDELCQLAYPSFADKMDQLICVGGMLKGVLSATGSEGNSGGPASCTGENRRPVLCGVASFGGDVPKCLRTKEEKHCPPSVFADVSYFSDWVRKVPGPQENETLYKL